MTTVTTHGLLHTSRTVPCELTSGHSFSGHSWGPGRGLAPGHTAGRGAQRRTRPRGFSPPCSPAAPHPSEDSRGRVRGARLGTVKADTDEALSVGGHSEQAYLSPPFYRRENRGTRRSHHQLKSRAIY